MSNFASLSAAATEGGISARSDSTDAVSKNFKKISGKATNILGNGFRNFKKRFESECPPVPPKDFSTPVNTDRGMSKDERLDASPALIHYPLMDIFTQPEKDDKVSPIATNLVSKVEKAQRVKPIENQLKLKKKCGPKVSPFRETSNWLGFMRLSPFIKSLEGPAVPPKDIFVPTNVNPSYDAKKVAKTESAPPKAKLKYGPKVSPYLNPKISVAAIVMRKNNFNGEHELLLTQRWINPQKGFWEFPGDLIGHQEPRNQVLRILKQQTNLDGTHAETLCVRDNPARDGLEHTLTFFFFITLPDAEHEVSLKSTFKMVPDANDMVVETSYSKVDSRVMPSWAWWYPVSQLPNWYTDQERIDMKKPLDDKYELVKVAFNQQMIFPLIRTRINEFADRICEPEFAKQPLNAYSRLKTDTIVVRKRRDSVYEIALIERKKDPFKGKKAFPGGFVDYKEDPTDAAVRRLEEDTLLVASPSNTHFLGHRSSPQRDPRVNTVCCVYVIKVDPKSLSGIMGGDYDPDFRWYNLEEVFEWAKLPHVFAFDYAETVRDFKTWWERTGKENGWYVEEEHRA
ncbi:hypothetical protein HK098_001870 [Nowakowskiella sp. JEL0407]|nr:hypothetical protein HK098_001870 [Nowakowskiella sp. JEL0407]